MPKRNNHNVFFLFKNSIFHLVDTIQYPSKKSKLKLLLNVYLKTFECRGLLHALIKPTGPFLPDL